MIPVNKCCVDCGAVTWREELGAADRFWHDGFVCKEHASARALEAKKSADMLQQTMGWPRIYAKELADAA